MHIHIHHHDFDDEVIARLDRMERKIDQITNQGETLMALDKVLVTRLNEVTDAIAKRIQNLLDANKAQTPLTPAEIAEVEADIARLEAMGKDEANPVPG